MRFHVSECEKRIPKISTILLLSALVGAANVLNPKRFAVLPGFWHFTECVRDWCASYGRRIV
jgi:hypothetical protein